MTAEGEVAREREAFLKKRAEAFRADYRGALKTMVKALFHADADPALVRHTEERMLKTPAPVAYSMLSAFVSYDSAASARGLKVPVRAINGDLYPTNVAAVRKVIADFDAIVMPHTGHYPMLEKPEEFNRHIAAVAAELDAKQPR